jgi:surface polysaccharide O-acyltransferase-like enzyme
MTSPNNVVRRADLDWLRVIAFGLLIFYHSGLAWSGWTFHITSADSIHWLREILRFMNRWRMPLIFVVSGAAIVFALSARSPIDFAADRLRRLLLPLAFGMVVLVPPQDYLAFIYDGRFHGSFLNWMAQAFAGHYPAGKLSPHHLWFLAYVLALTFILLPCFLLLRTAQGRALHARIGRATARRGLQWLMPLPLAATILWLTPISDGSGFNLIGPWYGLSYYSVLLLYGAFIYGSPELLAALNRQCFMSLAIAMAVYVMFYSIYIDGEIHPQIARMELPAYALISAVNTMAWLFAIIGLANRYLAHPSAVLVIATEAVYPLYLIHQTVMMFVVYAVLKSGTPPLLGYLLTTAATFLGSAAVYIYLVRPFWFVRPFFGMKSGHVGSAQAQRLADAQEAQEPVLPAPGASRVTLAREQP